MSPDEIERMKRNFGREFGESLDFAFSDNNPYFRASQHMEKGASPSEAISHELHPVSDRFEANPWLKQGRAAKEKRFIHTYSPAKSQKLVDELFGAGATAVWIGSPVLFSHGQTTDILIVGLPIDPELRTAIARVHQREMAKAWCFDPSEEEMEEPTGSLLLFQYT